MKYNGRERMKEINWKVEGGRDTEGGRLMVKREDGRETDSGRERMEERLMVERERMEERLVVKREMEERPMMKR